MRRGREHFAHKRVNKGLPAATYRTWNPMHIRACPVTGLGCVPSDNTLLTFTQGSLGLVDALTYSLTHLPKIAS